MRKPVTLPVGSNFDFCQQSVSGFNYGDVPDKSTTQLGYQKAFNFDAINGGVDARSAHETQINGFVRECDEACANYWNEKDDRAYLKDNCMRDCRRIWWEETHCIPTPDVESLPVKYTSCGANEGAKEYRIPIGASHKHKDSDKPGVDQSKFGEHKRVVDKLNESFENEREAYHRKSVHRLVGKLAILLLLATTIILLCCFRRR